MEENENEIERIDEFLLGNHAKEEENRIKKEILNSKPLNQSVETQKKIQSAILLSEREKMKTELKVLHQNLGFGKDKNSWKKYKWVILILSISTCFMCWYLLSKTEVSNQSIFASNYSAHSFSSNLRGDNPDKDLSEAYSFYNKGKYTEASTVFIKVLESDNENNEAKIALANSYIEQGKYADATSILDEVIKADDPFFVDHARWYMALVCIQQNKVSDAKQQLTILVSDANSDHHQDADNLLKSLK